jgi:Cof subfamily protein (haloacid dehalogenase superfamily)
MFQSARSFAHALGLSSPVVAYQGAMIREQDSAMIQHTPIAREVALEVLSLLNEWGFHTNVYVNDQLYMHRQNPNLEEYCQLSGSRPELCDDLLKPVATEAPTKLLVIDPDRIDSLLPELRERFSDRLDICKSRSNFCEIIDVNASKWNAVYYLAQQWGIEAEEIMAIGDQGNDVSMLSQAGICVAMGAAPAYVKQLAHFVTGTVDEDGVATAVEKFILTPEHPEFTTDSVCRVG